MKILVTGATGFVGSYLVPKLIQNGYQVSVLVRNVEKAKKLFDSKCEIIQGNIENIDSIKNCCNQVDIVFHLAAKMGHDSPSAEALKKFRKTNVEGLKNLIEISKKAHIKKFILISSTAALGLQNEPVVDENTPCHPYTPYQVSKREGEILALAEYEKNKFPIIIIRPSMIYGPGFKGDFLILSKVCSTGFFPKIGNGKNLSPALYISDLVEGLACFVEKGKEGEIYMISSAGSYTLRETAEVIGNALNKKMHYIYIPKCLAILGAEILEKICHIVRKKPPVTKRNIMSITADRTINISKISQELQYYPKIDLAEGLPKTIEYFVEKKYIRG